jgi:acyl-CoA synthetase (NDP forming)
VVLKAVSQEFAHKSEAGLVSLDLVDAAQVETAAGELVRKARCEASSGVRLEGLLVQEMVRSGVEMIVGVNTDPQFGPILLLGAGGIWVELLEDVVLRLPPLTHNQALSMVSEIRASKLLQGYRGAPVADIPALQYLLVQVGQLALEQQDRIETMDLNPVMVLPAGQGVKVVDFRVYPRQQGLSENFE